MKASIRTLTRAVALFCTAITLTACTSANPSADTAPKPAPTPAATAQPSPKPATPATPVAAAALRPTLRIKAGLDTPLTDAKGVVWAADTGYDQGTSVDRPDLAITGSPTPELYHAERYSMKSYSFKLPNGNYLLKLHFSEDFDGIASPTDRLFTYAVKDGTPAAGKTIKEVKDFSPWKASGDHFKAYIDAVPVSLTSGQLSITFTPQVENPQINAIEIIPQ